MKTRYPVLSGLLALLAVGIAGCSSSNTTATNSGVTLKPSTSSGQQASTPQGSAQQLSAEQQPFLDREQNGGQPAQPATK